jgi:hypothetical protein
VDDADPVSARYDALEQEHRQEPLICFEEDVARITKVPLARMRRMLLLNEWPIHALPAYGLDRPRKGRKGQADVEARPCWSKYLVLRFLAEHWDDDTWRHPRPPWQPAAVQPVREHHYVRYLRNRARWSR